MITPAIDPKIVHIFIEHNVHLYQYHPEIQPLLSDMAKKIGGPDAIFSYDNGLWLLSVSEKSFEDHTNDKSRLSAYTQDEYLSLANKIGQQAIQTHRKLNFACNNLNKILEYAREYKQKNPSADKNDIAQKLCAVFKLQRQGSLYHGSNFHIRMSQLKGSTTSFNNTVLSLSSLLPHDHEPCAVLIVREDRVDAKMINSSFLKTISHSSKNLTLQNVRGTFLGTDIVSSFSNLENSLDHGIALMQEHLQIKPYTNLKRLVEATQKIEGSKPLYQPSAQEYKNISTGALIARKWFQHPEWKNVEHILQSKVLAVQKELLALASNTNVNLRGNSIESLITGENADHKLEDLIFDLGSKYRLVVDVKSKILDKKSNPKGVNLDKLLHSLASGTDIHAYFFVIIDPHTGTISSRLVPMLDTNVMTKSTIQAHWSGRNSRGTTQLLGSDIVEWTSSAYSINIDPRISRTILQQWVKMNPNPALSISKTLSNTTIV